MLYYFEGMTDVEIGKLFNTSRSTIQYRRTKDVVKTEAFAEQMRDVVEYRVLDYYQRRYDRKKSG